MILIDEWMEGRIGYVNFNLIWIKYAFIQQNTALWSCQCKSTIFDTNLSVLEIYYALYFILKSHYTINMLAIIHTYVHIQCRHYFIYIYIYKSINLSAHLGIMPQSTCSFRIPYRKYCIISCSFSRYSPFHKTLPKSSLEMHWVL